MSRGRSMDETPSQGQRMRWDQYVTKWSWDEKGGYRSGRFYGNVVTEFIHSIKTKNGQFYPEFCHGWDIDNCRFYPDKEDRCPCCALGIKGSYRYFMNVIDLEAEENKPSKTRPDWTPIRFIDMSTTLFARVKELKTVNKGYAVSDTLHGANVQIKYNSTLDAGSQYGATIDTKDVAITEEQKEYIVVQKYPDGSMKTIRGENGLPAQFEYIRCMNTRDEMIRSLKTHGYYGAQDEPSTLENEKPKSKDEIAAEAMEKEPEIEQMEFANNLDAELDKNVFPIDKKEKSKERVMYEECPTDFGNFAGHIDCHTKCDVRDECQQKTATNKAAKKETKRKPVVEITDDDDDTL